MRLAKETTMSKLRLSLNNKLIPKQNKRIRPIKVSKLYELLVTTT